VKRILKIIQSHPRYPHLIKKKKKTTSKFSFSFGTYGFSLLRKKSKTDWSRGERRMWEIV